MKAQTIYWIVGAVVLLGVIGYFAGWFGGKKKSTSTVTGS